ETEESSLEVFTVAYDHDVNISRAVRVTREGVGMAGRAAPDIRVGGCEHHAIGIGPIVVQAFPYAPGAFSNISLRATARMHLQVLVRTVGKQLRAAGAEIGESGNILLRCQGRCPMKVDRRHAFLLG